MNKEQEFNNSVRELDARAEEKLQNFFKGVMAKLPLLVGIGIAVFWIFYGTVEIVPTSLSLVDRVGLTICTVILAITYCNLLADGGFKSAKLTLDYINASTEYEVALKNGIVYTEEINNYALVIARKNLYEARRNSLRSVGLKYEDYFEDNGDFKQDKLDFKKDKRLNKKQKKYIKKCMRLQIIVPNIMSLVGGSFFGLKRYEEERSYRAKSISMQTVIRAVLSIASVGFMFNFLGFNTGAMIYALFQIVLWTGSGVGERIKNYNFVIEKTIPQLKEKTLIINGYLELNHKEVIDNGC